MTEQPDGDRCDDVRVLVIEDNPVTLEALRAFLERAGYAVLALPDGGGLTDGLAGFRPDVVVLDIMLPGEDGVALLRRIREVSDVPVAMFTVRGEAGSQVASLDHGADAYLTKGIDLTVVDATLRRLVARARGAAGPLGGWVLRAADWHLVAPNGAAVRLTAGEFFLMSALAEGAPDVVSRAAILTAQKKPDTVSNARNLDVYVRRLRTKVEAAVGQAPPIRTVYATGFAFTEPLRKT